MNDTVKKNCEVLCWLAENANNIAICHGVRYKILGGCLTYYAICSNDYVNSTNLHCFLLGNAKLVKYDPFVAVTFGQFIDWYKKNELKGRPYRFNENHLVSGNPLKDFLKYSIYCDPNGEYRIPAEDQEQSVCGQGN